jgi:hypothetical protein
MYRSFLQALCVVSFCLLVAGAAGTFTAQRASAQSPIFNPLAPNYFPVAPGISANYPYGVLAGLSMSPYTTSYTLPNVSTYQTIPAMSYTSVSTSAPISFSNLGMYPSSSTPFSANGTMTTQPDSCDLYDSYCAYCTAHPSATMCKQDPPVTHR